MKSLFTFLLIGLMQVISAQEQEYAYSNGVFNFEDNKTQKVFTEWARVRQSPDVRGRVSDSLQSNQQVVVLQKEPVALQLGERSANWYKVSYQKDGETKEGYIWGGNLAIGYRNKDGYDFLFGISKTIDRTDKKFNQVYKQNIASVRAMQGNRLVSEVTFDTGSAESLSYATFTTESNHKLKEVLFTLKASVSGEACGIPGYDQYMLFKNQKLIALPQLMNVGDADVYYHDEKFISPMIKVVFPMLLS